MAIDTAVAKHVEYAKEKAKEIEALQDKLKSAEKDLIEAQNVKAGLEKDLSHAKQIGTLGA